MTAAVKRFGAGCLVVVGCAVALGGCGGRSLNITDAPSGGSAGMDSAGGGFAGGVAVSGGASAGAGGFVGTVITQSSQPRGLVSASQSSVGPNTFTYLMTAEFSTSVGPWDGCTREQLGSCWFYDCPVRQAPTNPPLVDAGDLSATGTSGAIPIPRFNAFYALMGSAELWDPLGGSLTFSGAGSKDVPPFIITIITPPSVLLTTFNGGEAPSTLARNAGVKLEWTAVGAGKVNFELDQVAPQGKHPTAACQFDANAGAGELSAAVLGQLDPGFYGWHIEGASSAAIDNEAWHIDAKALGFGSVVTGQELELQ